MLLITITTILACTAMLATYAVRVARHGRATHERLGASPGSALLPGWLVEAFYWALQAPGRAFTSLRIDPDTLTYCSLAFSLTALPLTAMGRFPEAAIMIVLGGGLDALDGMVARARGCASQSGAVLDSFVDRLADAAPYMGLAVFYRDRVWTLLLPLAAMTASSLVSYARAKADIYKLKLPNGLMRRHERIAYLVVSLLVAPIAPRAELTGTIAYPATLMGVAIIAVVGFIASFVLVARTRAALSAETAPLPAQPAAPRHRAPQTQTP